MIRPMALHGGIDLGGTKIQAAILDADHEVLGSSRRPTPTEGSPAGVAADGNGFFHHKKYRIGGRRRSGTVICKTGKIKTAEA